MRHVALALAVFLLFAWAAAAQDAPPAAKPRVEAAWRPLPEVSGDTLRFVVLADNQPHGDPEKIAQTEVFGGLVAEVNLLSPDLALFAGDLIHGYEADRETLQEMWDAFDGAAAKLEIPYRMAPGNHCIWDRQSEDVWKERYGPLHYAFTVGGCRFVALDTEESFGTTDRLSPEQISWLGKEVEGAMEMKHLFVFLHKPLWRFDPGRGPWMEQVHPLLAKHPSAIVFAGHFHTFERSNDRDGVRYYITPAAGGPIGNVEAAGEIHGFLNVVVRGDEVTVAAVRSGGVLPDTFLGEDMRERYFQMGRSVTLAPVPIRSGQPISAEGALSLVNHLDEPIDVEVSWTLPEACAWTVAVPSPKARVAAGETGSVSVRLAAKGEIFPTPVFRVVGRAGGKVVLDQESDWPVRLERRLKVAKAAAAPKIDGVLDDPAWKAAEPAGRFLRLGGDGFAKRATTWRALWDDEHLYCSFALDEPAVADLVALAGERDWMMIQDDVIVLYLDPVRDGKSRFCFGVNAAGVPMEYRAPEGVVDPKWDGPWRYAVKTGEKGWTIELAIPWSALGIEPAAGKTFAVGAYRNANPGEREFSGWTLPVERLSNPEGFGEAVLE